MNNKHWTKYRLSQIMEITGGGTPKTSVPEYWNGDIPWLSVVDFAGKGRWVCETEKSITQEGLNASSTNILKKNQVIISARGTVGEIAQTGRDMAFNQSCYGLNGKLGIIQNDYLYYLLKHNIQDLRKNTHGAVFDTITRQTFDCIDVNVPPIEEQNTIVKILSALDEKIELNHQMNKTLEEIGQALFKRWFVDFEFPDEDDKPYKSSGGKIIDSELGDIPQGWAISKLGDIGTFKNGINYLRDEVGDSSFFIANVRDIANNKLLLKESLDKINIDSSKAEDYLLQQKDILIARSACPGEISLVLGELEDVIYSGFSIRYRLNNPDDYLYIYHIMQGLKRNLQNFAVGTTLQSVNQETLKNMKFISPSNRILNEFNRLAKQLLDKILNNLIQNRELSQIRDSLLPKLMSGKIRVQHG